MDGNATAATPATSGATSSSAGTTWLGQATEPGQEQPGQPGGSPPPPPEPPVQEPVEPAQGGDDPARNGDANEGEPAAPDEKAYAGLALPEGLVVDDAALGDFRKLAAEARLPVETAQRLLDLHTRMQAEAERSYAATVAAWGKEAEADPYLSGQELASGGFPSFQDAKIAAKRFMATYGSPELREALNASGMGNHPLLIRALARAGRDLAADNLIPGRATPRVDPLHARYPRMSEEFFPH